MVWGCFCFNGTVGLTQIKDIMDKFLYRDILQNHIAIRKRKNLWKNINVIEWRIKSPRTHSIY